MRPQLREFLSCARGPWFVRNQSLRLAPSKSQDRNTSLICVRLFLGKVYIGCDMQPRAARVATDRLSPSLPREVAEKTSAKYREAFEQLTGSRLHVDS
jgi:hypothetical protein